MKKMLSIDELIQHMKKKGIRFNDCSEIEAKNFLQKNNYYFKLASYRNLYPKVILDGARQGQYQNLDFAYLKELSYIDKELRYLIIKMCLDIEHAIKTKLINEVSMNSDEDGYEIVKKYFSSEDLNFYTLKSIRKHKSGEYCKNLISKYYPYFPIWVLVELISFGELLHICQFYENTYNQILIPKNKFMNTIRDLRNACAHSNCLLNNLPTKMVPTKQPDSQITTFIRDLDVASARSRSKNLHKVFTYNFMTLLYVYNELLPERTKKTTFCKLQEFMNTKVIRHKDYFLSNSQITSTYNFINKVIDKLATQY